jgi:hypothetical protein
MQVLVKVSKFYDWLPVNEKDIAEPDAIYSRDAAGKAMKQVLVEVESETTVSIPQSQIESTYENFRTDPVPFSRLSKAQTPTRLRDYPETLEGVYAWHLFEKTMPLHAPVEAWGKVSVEHDKKLEKFLNNLLKGDKQ